MSSMVFDFVTSLSLVIWFLPPISLKSFNIIAISIIFHSFSVKILGGPVWYCWTYFLGWISISWFVINMSLFTTNRLISLLKFEDISKFCTLSSSLCFFYKLYSLCSSSFQQYFFYIFRRRKASLKNSFFRRLSFAPISFMTVSNVKWFAWYFFEHFKIYRH